MSHLGLNTNITMHIMLVILCLLKDSNTLESFIVFSNFGTILIIKRFQYIGIFYCFSNFGTILIKRFRFYRNLLLFFEFRYYPYY